MALPLVVERRRRHPEHPLRGAGPVPVPAATGALEVHAHRLLQRRAPRVRQRAGDFVPRVRLGAGDSAACSAGAARVGLRVSLHVGQELVQDTDVAHGLGADAVARHLRARRHVPDTDAGVAALRATLGVLEAVAVRIQ